MALQPFKRTLFASSCPCDPKGPQVIVAASAMTLVARVVTLVARVVALVAPAVALVALVVAFVAPVVALVAPAVILSEVSLDSVMKPESWLTGASLLARVP
jgi:hypothetical protein